MKNLTLALVIQNNGIPGHLTGKMTTLPDGAKMFAISDGFRRIRAIDLLASRGFDVGLIPIDRETKGYSIEDRLYDMFVKNKTKHPTPIEEAEIFKRLQAKGHTPLMIGKRIGKSDDYVRSMIDVACMPQKVKNDIAEGTISPALANEISKSVKRDEDLLVESIEEAKVEANKKGKKKVTADDVTAIKEKKVKTNPVMVRFTNLKELINDQASPVNLENFIDQDMRSKNIQFLAKIVDEIIECVSSKKAVDITSDYLLKLVTDSFSDRS